MNNVLQATATPRRLNHLDYLPPLEHARPSTALWFPGCRQIAAYRAGTVLILARTRPGNSWRAPLRRSYRKRCETTNEIAHTTRLFAGEEKVERGAGPSPNRRESYLSSPIHLHRAAVILFYRAAFLRDYP